MMSLSTPPTHKGYAFKLWMLYEDDDGERQRCDTFDHSEWYVLRDELYHHGISATCSDTSKSCVLADQMNGSPVSGEFGVDLDSLESPVWYDAPNPVPGLYRYAYKMCSFYEDPQQCSRMNSTVWKFEGVDSVPFSPTNN